MDWRERYADKLTSAEDAARQIESGDRLWIGMFDGLPISFSKALLSRHAELRNVQIYHYLCLFPWMSSATKDAFHLTTAFATPVDRPLVAEGLSPPGRERVHELRRDALGEQDTVQHAGPDLRRDRRGLAGRWIRPHSSTEVSCPR